jgi:AraC-like DNA-binding protein
MPRFSHYIPKPPLSDYIELIWIYEGYSAQHAKERLLPTGSMDLVFALDEDQRVGCSLVGAQTQFTILDVSRPISVMGVHFKPGGAFPFFGMPAGEFQGIGVPLDLVWGGFAGEVRDRLLEAKTHGAKYRILENALLARAHGRLGKHPAVRFALDVFGRAESSSVADVTHQIGLSARRFIEVFRNEVGLPPKLYCRVRRFQNVVAAIHKLHDPDLAEMALVCGYFDQAHFIHDFRAFSGVSPSAYLKHRTSSPNHVAILD